MRSIFGIFLIGCIWGQTTAQTDTLSFKNHATGGNLFYINGKRISAVEFRKVININPEAGKMYEDGKSIQSFSNIVGFIGGGMLGLGFSDLLLGNPKRGVPLAAIGAGVAVLGLTFQISGNKKIQEATKIYNSSLHYN